MDATNTPAGNVDGANSAEYEKAVRYPTTMVVFDVFFNALWSAPHLVID